MDLQEFKNEARRRGHFTDNKKNAMAEWSRGWGLGTSWRARWAYKRYELGNLSYASGSVVCRHGSYREVECRINGEPVSEYRFKRELKAFQAPELTADEQSYIEAENARQRAEMARLAARARSSRGRHRSVLDPVIEAIIERRQLKIAWPVA